MTMKAVRVHAWGGPNALRYEEDVPKPSAPGPGDLLVRVRAAGVNPVDWKAREGRVEGLWPHTLPLVLGWDASGTVEAVGEGVTNFAPGDEVFAHIDVARDGAYAEYAVVAQEGAARKPDALTHVEAASLPIAAETAWQSLFEIGGLAAGQTVLVHAAAGGVGHFAVQFARWKGARVIGTASARNHDFVRSLGADEVIDYTRDDWPKEVRRLTDRQGVDVVFEHTGAETWPGSVLSLKRDGRLVTCGATSGFDARTDLRQVFYRHLSLLGSFMGSKAELLDAMKFVERGQLRAVVDRTLPLAEARRAHELMQDRAQFGKLVLEMP